MADLPPEGGDAQGPGGGPPPESTISDVMVDGNTLTFKRELKLDQGPMTLSYTAMVDGDTMTGQAHTDFGPIPITGTRQ